MSSLKAYTILRPLDRGAHGQVVLAERNRDKKQFAIKIVNASNDTQASQYLQEAVQCLSFRHPSVLTSETAFWDYLENFGARVKVVCMVMEYAEGGNLRQLIEQRQTDNRRFVESEILDIAVCILEALQYFYVEHELVHRDIKPANILICNGAIKVADFGESKRLMETLTHTVRGTPSYMAPELLAQHLMGESGAHYGPKADVFSVGMVVLDMATLEQGGRRDAANVRGRLSRASGHYSAEFMQWLTAMLEQDPSRRLSMEAAVRQAIECKSMVTYVPRSAGMSGPRARDSEVASQVGAGSNGVSEDAVTMVRLQQQVAVMAVTDERLVDRSEEEAVRKLIKLQRLHPEYVATDEDLSSIFNAMRMFPTSEIVQSNACEALRNFVVKNADNQISIAAGGGIELLLAAMRGFPQSEGVQKDACRTLWILSANNAENQVSIAAGGGIDLIVAAMRGFPQSKEVQKKACGALSEISLMNVENKASIAAVGGIELLLAAMREFPQSVYVQKNACRALMNLSANNVENKVSIAAGGGIDLIVAAMRGFPQSEAVQKNACGALSEISLRNVENKVSIAAAGGIDLIVAAMRGFPQSHDVQKKACGALAILSVKNAENQVSIAAAGGIDLIVAAMRGFPQSEDVQNNACAALSNLSVKNVENKASIAAAGGIELMQAAARAFPVLEKYLRNVES